MRLRSLGTGHDSRITTDMSVVSGVPPACITGSPDVAEDAPPASGGSPRVTADSLGQNVRTKIVLDGAPVCGS